jgi:hypothetical protein
MKTDIQTDSNKAVGSGDWLGRSIVAALFVQENGCYAGLPGVDAISSCNPRDDGL